MSSTTEEAPRFDNHPHYNAPCPDSLLTSTLGRRQVRTIKSLYPQPMTMADYEMEKAIDRGSITILDGAWGPKTMPIPVAAAWGLKVTDLVISNGAARGFIPEDEAASMYVTLGKPADAWRSLATAETLRMQHQQRTFVLSESPEAFDLDVLWELGYSIWDLNLASSPEAHQERTTADLAAEMCTAPFTPDQVEALQAWQSGDKPARCGSFECKASGAPVLDVAEQSLSCPQCGKTRSWVWRAMTE